VESALSHADRYLWVPYYRRDFDTNGTSPSAVAIVDTRTDRIVRVLATGPVPKFVAVSPDDSRVAVTHWGDNTVMLVDTSSGDPATFRVLPRLLVAESRLPLVGLPEEVDRDEDCGFCLRGAVFTPDGRTLLVGRMAGGGVAGFDVEAGTYLGTVTGMRPTPRHLVVAGEWLYLSANSAGWVARVGLDAVVRALRAARGRTVPLEGWQEVEVGGGARTLEVTADGRFAFVAVYNTAELAVIDTSSMTVAARIGVDPFPVGLDIAPDGTRVWTTSQGFQGMGGNSVGVYDVSLPP
jgi:DNA-binding beta-propeller fold protein YncE